MSGPNQESHGGGSAGDPNPDHDQGAHAGQSAASPTPQPSSAYPPPPPGGPFYPPAGGPPQYPSAQYPPPQYPSAPYPPPGGPSYPPPGGPSYPPPSGPPPGWPPQGPPPGGKPGKGPLIVVVAVAAVGVLVLGAIGIWLIVGSGDSGSNTAATTSSTSPGRSTSAEPTTGARGPEPTRRSRTTTAPPPPDDGLNDQLMGLLSAGHDASNCEPVAVAGTALATVDCGPSTLPGGPASTRYSLFGDLATLDEGFDEAIGVNDELLDCPGSGLESPSTWHYTDTPDDVAGMVACGTYNGNPDLVWTNDEALLLADAQGPDLAELHEWWIEFG